MNKNTLYYGDNLDILRRYVPDESVDLVYLDPPFNSKATYNVLFREKDGTDAAAQIEAFDDFWHWDEAAAEAYFTVVEAGGQTAEALRAFRILLGDNDMLAYLAMMAPRLVELRRVLKPTGSLYLHCDPTASHYLKVLLDAVFGFAQFRSEVIWKRTSAHSSANRFGPVHDVLLFYGRTGDTKWIGGAQAYDPEYVRRRFRQDAERPWKDADLTGSGIRHGETGQVWRGFDVTAKGRHWAYPPTELERLDADGRVYWPPKKGAWPRLRQFLDELPGVPLQDVWTDIPPINALAKERLGYPTQKPEALLERIVAASSNEGDHVLDPFCGCGTTVAVAQKLDRRWTGIDITHLAITLMRTRLMDAFGEDLDFRVIGEPTSVPDAAALAEQDPFQFEVWALGLVGARPAEQKKGADRGIDGRRYFHDDTKGATKQIVFSVKAGKTGRAHVHELRGVMERENAQMAALLSMQEPTQPMRSEAASAGYYESPLGSHHPRIQLLTVGELLEGERLDLPRASLDVTHKRAPKAKDKSGEQGKLDV